MVVGSSSDDDLLLSSATSDNTTNIAHPNGVVSNGITQVQTTIDIVTKMNTATWNYIAEKETIVGISIHPGW